MQRQILINVMVFFAYALNLPLNTQRPHHRSQRAGKLGLDFGSWQSPDISRSHLYRGTFPWTPPTAIYRAYTVSESMMISLPTHICVTRPQWVKKILVIISVSVKMLFNFLTNVRHYIKFCKFSIQNLRKTVHILQQHIPGCLTMTCQACFPTNVDIEKKCKIR